MIDMAGDAETAEPRGRLLWRHHRAPIQRSDSETGYAPADWSRVECLSRSGRWRYAHVRAADGRCLFCDELPE